MSVAAIEIEPTGIEPTGIEPTGIEPTGAEPRCPSMSAWSTLVVGVIVAQSAAESAGFAPPHQLSKPGAGSDWSFAEPIRSELQWTLFRSVVTKLTSFSGSAASRAFTVAFAERRSRARARSAACRRTSVPASTSAQVAWSALQVATFVPGAGTSPQSGSCERRSDESPIEPTGRSSRPIEPTGIEPTGIEPTGIEPTGIEPDGDRADRDRADRNRADRDRADRDRADRRRIRRRRAVRRRLRRRARDEREPRVRDVGELHRS